LISPNFRAFTGHFTTRFNNSIDLVNNLTKKREYYTIFLNRN
jgi:hypothetical protein